MIPATSSKQWVLSNTRTDEYLADWQCQDALPDGQPYHLQFRRLHGGLQDGVDVVEIQHSGLHFSILPTRGMGIWKGTAFDTTPKVPTTLPNPPVQLGWESPFTCPVHPKFVPLSCPSGLGWLHGFHEWIVRCGLESNGAPEFLPNGVLKYGLHGRIANQPADEVTLSVDETTGTITVRGVVCESRSLVRKIQLRTEISTVIGTSKMWVRDTVTNLSAEKSDMELLYHINHGTPFVSPGARFVVPFAKMAPRTAVAAAALNDWSVCGPETPNLDEVVYFFDPAADERGIVSTLLVSAAEDRGVLVEFPKSQLPFFSLWKSRRSRQDGYVTGMEPSVNFPNTKSFEKRAGRVVELEPGAHRHFEVSVEVLFGRDRMRQTESRISHIHRRSAAIVSPTILPEWSE